MTLRLKGRRAVLLAACLAGGLGVGAADAQDAGCVASNPNGAAAGALLGGVAGALFGNAVSGRHKAPGTILGGVTGAMAGAAIGGSASRQPCPDGYVYRGPDGPPPPAMREGADFWDGAPPTIRERIVFLRRRIERLDSDGWLSPRESDGLLHRLSLLAGQEENIRDRHDGRLPPDARAQLGDDLNDISRRLRWKEYQTRQAAE